MKTKLLLVFACGLAAVCTGRAADAAKPSAHVTVTYVAPENFTDVKSDTMGSDRDRDWLLNELKAQFESMARHYLAAGHSLEIQVTEVDLAGEFESWRGVEFDHIRILRDVYPPRLSLEFRLLDAQGKVLSGGKRQLRDLGYLMTIGMPSSDSLRYDKEMIREWMRSEFKRAS